VAEATDLEDHTRCITMPNLLTFFSKDFRFEVDENIPLIIGKVINVLEWRFGSYRCQAQ
jgi:hypothetical protein